MSQSAHKTYSCEGLSDYQMHRLFSYHMMKISISSKRAYHAVSGLVSFKTLPMRRNSADLNMALAF